MACHAPNSLILIHSLIWLNVLFVESIYIYSIPNKFNPTHTQDKTSGTSLRVPGCRFTDQLIAKKPSLASGVGTNDPHQRGFWRKALYRRRAPLSLSEPSQYVYLLLRTTGSASAPTAAAYPPPPVTQTRPNSELGSSEAEWDRVWLVQ